MEDKYEKIKCCNNRTGQKRKRYDLIRIANEKQVVSTPYSLDGCFEEEFELFYKILKGEEQHKSYEDFMAPVFVINAISRSLESGNEEVVRRF